MKPYQNSLQREPIHVRVATRVFNEQYGKKSAMVRTAGEIRFVKDQGPLKREIDEEFYFSPKFLKPMSRTLWSLSCAMGHLVSAHSIFTKIKAVNVSPDGKMGGKGYIQEIRAMRTSIAEAIEMISDTIDTLHDEVRAPHWQKQLIDLPKGEKKEVDEIIQDAEDIISDPDGYVEREYKDEITNDVK